MAEKRTTPDMTKDTAGESCGDPDLKMHFFILKCFRMLELHKLRNI